MTPGETSPSDKTRTRGRVPRLVTVAALTVASAGLALTTGAPAAADGPTTFSNAGPIAIPATGSPDQTGQANPYPSSITVAGMTGPVTKVTVSFNNLTHNALNDVDALLVAPTGANLVVLSDSGDPNNLTFANNATLTFDDAALTPIPQSGNVPTGSYKPTNTSGVDSFPPPAPAPSSQTTLAGAFTGINPNGTWQLFIVDDATGDTGTMAGGWSLTVTTEATSVATDTTVATSATPSTTGDQVTFTATVSSAAGPVTAGSVQFSDGGTNLGSPVPLNAAGVATFPTAALAEGTHEIRASYGGATGFLPSNGVVAQRVNNPTIVTGNTFCNTGPLTTPALGAATPYPSNITVSGLTGPVTKVTAALNGLSHTTPVDLDVLLTAPAPATNLILLSDVGGTSPVTGLNLVFDDAAPTGVPTPLVSGTFKPTDDDSDVADQAFPPPAPTPSAATTMATFNGSPPNGMWSLWVVDDASGDSGTIAGGWCLTVTATAPTSTALASDVNPSAFGQPVTFTATVTAGGAPVTGGTVSFTDGGSALGGPVPVAADGTAEFSTSALAVGSHPIVATYSGTTNFAGSSGDLTQVVGVAATDTALASDVNPSAFGQPVTFTATVTAGGAPVTGGTVSFTDGGSALGGPVPVAADGTAEFSTSALAVGSHPIVATYSGTTNFAGSSGDLTQVVGVAATDTALASDVNPSAFGQPVTFTATVTAGGAPVTGGTVSFTDGGSALGGPVPVAADGTAEFSTSALAVGSHPIVATYSGTTNFAGSSGDLTQVVGVAATDTALASDVNPSAFGQPVTFTATVTAGGAPVTGGTVSFTDGGSALGGPVPVAADGTAEFSTSALAVGSHPIVATYSGTTNFAGSSGDLTQVVGVAATDTALASDVNPSAFGQPVTFTATVTAGGAPVTGGTVTFSVDGTDVPGDVPVDPDGVATHTTATLPPGSHQIIAEYNGTPSYATSQDTLTQEVEQLVADAGGPYTVAEGGSLTLDGSGSTAGAEYGWDLNGDNDFTDATGLNPTLNWADLEAIGVNDGPSSRVIELRVTVDGLDATGSADLAVTNTAPNAVITGALTATVDQPFTVKVGADDPSSADMAAPFTYNADWGDGSPVETVVGPADPPITHTYTAAGDFTASFTATDKDGGVSEPTVVQVDVQPAATPTTPTATSAPPTATKPATAPTSANLPRHRIPARHRCRPRLTHRRRSRIHPRRSRPPARSRSPSQDHPVAAAGFDATKSCPTRARNMRPHPNVSKHVCRTRTFDADVAAARVARERR